MKVAVVGHVEWLDYLVTERLPEPGEILHVHSAHEGIGGGGGMAALAIQALGGSCTFFCALGDDDRAQRTAAELRAAGIDLEAAVHAVPHRRCMAFLTGDGERTIAVLGDRLTPLRADPLPWEALGSFDAVLFTAGDAGALRAAREARLLVAVPRAGEVLLEAGVRVDALVASAGDPDEAIPEELAQRAQAVVLTAGRAGGSWRRADGTTGRWEPAPLPGPKVDAYGCGDSFAAALTSVLGTGADLPEACAVAARVGAALLCERAPAVGELARLR
jgi:ribokinase